MAPVGLVTLTAAVAAAVQHSEWPDDRGPRCDGTALGAELPLRWSEEENVRWKTEVHGRGWSSPVVLGERIWVTTATPEGSALSVLAIDLATGAVLVDQVLFRIESPERRHALNSYASPSPVVADGRVFGSYGTYGAACLDAETAEIVWQRRDLDCDHIEGPGSSPFLYEGRLFLNVDGGDPQYVAALDAESGETLWRTERSRGDAR